MGKVAGNMSFSYHHGGKDHIAQNSANLVRKTVSIFYLRYGISLADYRSLLSKDRGAFQFLGCLLKKLKLSPGTDCHLPPTFRTRLCSYFKNTISWPSKTVQSLKLHMDWSDEWVWVPEPHNRKRKMSLASCPLTSTCVTPTPTHTHTHMNK